MEEFTVCEVLNNDDKKFMTIYAQWMEENIEIFIMRSGMVPLTGKTTITKLLENNHKKTREETIETIKNELSGKTNDIKFFLNDSRLRWKKKMWIRGTIEVQRVEDIIYLGNLCSQWAKQCQILQDRSKKLQESNETLEKKNQKLVSQIVEMEQVKKNMEETLYKRFLLLLNTKKRKIRELEEKFKNQNTKSNCSIYDKSTDESETEIEENSNKRKKGNQREFTPVASTSKRFSKSPLKPDPESDEDFNLRYDESQEEPRNFRLNLTEEDPDDDLFSQ